MAKNNTGTYEVEQKGRCAECTGLVFEMGDWAYNESGQLGHRDCFESNEEQEI